MTDETNTPQVIRLAGREFEMTGRAMTAAQENFTSGYLRLAGVMKILSAPNATMETHGEDVLTSLLLSGYAHHVIAGIMTETGKRWTRESALANAEAFADSTGADDKATLQVLMFGAVAGFFAREGKLPEISPSFSGSAPDRAGNNSTSVGRETLDVTAS